MLQEIAQTEAADVLVLGRRGRGLSHRLMGSVAERLARESDVPVEFASLAAGRECAEEGAGRREQPVRPS